jgi:hypothetical protein
MNFMMKSNQKGIEIVQYKMYCDEEINNLEEA